MVKRCAWGTCKTDSRYPERLEKQGIPVTFHRFPSEKKNKERRESWIRACCRGDGFVCKKDSYVCTLHFIGERGPSDEYPDPIAATAGREKIKRLSRKRKQPTLRMGYGKRFRTCNDKSAAESLLLLSNAIPAMDQSVKESNASKALLNLSNVKKEDVVDTNEALVDVRHPTVTDTKECTIRATQTNVSMQDLHVYPDSQLQSQKIMSRSLFLQNVENPKNTTHYTGLEISVVKALYNLVKEKATRIHMWKGTKKTKTKYTDNKYLKQKYGLSVLSTWEQLILTLVRLRRKLTITVLAHIFGISTGTASRIIMSWILFLEKELSFLLHFSTVSELSGLLFPKAFRDIPNLRGIIDCTEFYIETPNRLPSQRSTYSNYKSRNTFKLLVSISPIGHLNFTSNLFSGSISDKEIIRQSGFLDALLPNDVIMADKGFNVQDLLALRQAKLLAPPIMRKGVVSAKASTITRRIARVRIHVERIIRKLKCFGILRGVIPLTLKPYVSSIVKVCAGLVNLQPCVINDDDEM